MQRFFGVAQDMNGNAIPSVAITVTLAGTATLATLFSDNTYTPLTNPFTSNTDGTYQFFTRNGTYDVVLFKSGSTFVAAETASVTLDDDMSVISPAQITADQNDYAPTNGLNATAWRLTANATRTITGIAAGYSQQELFLTNVGVFTILLSHQSSLSTAANRFATPTANNYTLGAGATARLVYDAATARWRIADLGVQSQVEVIAREELGVIINNSAAETSVYSTTIAANTLGSNRKLRVRANGRFTNTTGVNRGARVRFKYGGVTLVDLNASSLNDGITNGLSLHDFDLCANASLTVQIGYASNMCQLTAAGSGAPTLAVRGTSAINSTLDQTLEMTVQLSVADPALTFVRELITVELV